MAIDREDSSSLRAFFSNVTAHRRDTMVLRGEDEFCVEDDFSGAIRAVTGVIFGARLPGRLIS